jgi:hypothetical protein
MVSTISSPTTARHENSVQHRRDTGASKLSPISDNP